MVKPIWGWIQLSAAAADLISSDKVLSNFDCRVLFALMARVQQKSSMIYVTQAVLAQHLCCTRPKVTASLNRLTERGYVIKVANGRYRLHGEVGSRKEKRDD